VLVGILIDCGSFQWYAKCMNFLLYSKGSTSMDPQISPWGGYCVGFGATWARLLG